MKRVDLVTRFLLATLIVAAMAGATWFSPATAAEAPAAKKLAHAVAGLCARKRRLTWQIWK